MIYCTFENPHFFDNEMVSAITDVHPTLVRPTVLCVQFVHSDDHEVSRGVVVQRETILFRPLVVYVCPDQTSRLVAEVLSIALQVLWIFTREGKCLSFPASYSCGLDTCQGCQ